MYYAMDEIGIENAQIIKTITSEPDRWRFIYDTAKTYGFDGIHFTPSLYRSFNLDLNNIPSYFRDFLLTFHFGGMPLNTESEYETFDRDFSNAFEIARKHKMQDISVHPPGAYNLTTMERDLTLKLLSRAVDKWLKLLMDNGISLSLETHVAGEWFVFSGLYEYGEFVDKYPELGVLIDISHNYYNPQYSEDDIVNILGNRNVKGLHISDALRSAEFEAGTHLPVGDGTINFPKLLKGFEKFDNLYGALEIKSNNVGIEKSLKKLRNIKNEM